MVDRRGFYDWVKQRVSAVLIGLYTIFIFAFLFTHSPLDYFAWKARLDGA
jgi:succinate dehydrogenase / fumarate reductase membrane anchor subunit